MMIIRRSIYAQILQAVGFVTLAFLLLFFFFDLTDEVSRLQEHADVGYQLRHAVLQVLLMIPGHLYELLPITVLIGTIFVMARLAANSEFTILRISGLGPLQALSTLIALGVCFAALTFLFGDYLAPLANSASQNMQIRFSGQLTRGQTGAWIRDQDADSNSAINIGSLTPDAQMKGIRIFQLNRQNGQLQSYLRAESGQFANQEWILHEAQQRNLPITSSPDQKPNIQLSFHESLAWPSNISSNMVAAALISPDRMKTWDLHRFIQHLKANKQSSQHYEIEFWRKIFYPLSCLVMMVLALPFAYLHFRKSNITAMVFIGVLIGISFFLLNNVSGFIGNLHNWPPWLAAGLPGMSYSLLSLAAFAWLVSKQ